MVIYDLLNYVDCDKVVSMVKKFRDRKDDIRRNKRTRHPAIIFKKEGHNYWYHGLTHAPETDGIKNIKLNKNPNPNDSTPAYFRPEPQKDNKDMFDEKYDCWKLSKSDKKRMEKYQK